MSLFLGKVSPIAFFVLCLFVWHSAAVADTPLAVSDPLYPLKKLGPGTHNQTIQRSGKPALKYTISIPENIAEQATLPLILALHYSGHDSGSSNGASFFGEEMLYDLIDPAFSNLNAMIVAPDAPASDWLAPESEAYVVTLTRSLLASYRIDPNKVVLTGYSIGGTGAWLLGTKYPSLFSLMIPVSADASSISASVTALTVKNTNVKQLVYVIHSKKDELFAFSSTQAFVNTLQAKHVQIQLNALEDASHYDSYAFIDSMFKASQWLIETWKVKEQ